MVSEGQIFARRYQLVSQIGQRSASKVFYAIDNALHRPVAVKILSSEVVSDGNFLRRFRAETQAAARLDHPGIVLYYDWGIEDSVPYVVSELCEGGSLRDILEAGHTLTPSQALEVGIQVAEALKAAHEQNLIHSGIAPSNILFTSDAKVKLTDFALAALHAESDLPTDRIFGPSFYAAPEEVESKELTPKADVYALAVVLVEAVTGEHPFAGESALNTLWDRLTKPLPTPEVLGEFAWPLRRAGTIDPKDRCDLDELLASFRTLRETLPADASPATPVPPASDDTPTTQPPPVSATPPDTPASPDTPPSLPLQPLATPEELRALKQTPAEDTEEADSTEASRTRNIWIAAGAVCVILLAFIIGLWNIGDDSSDATRKAPDLASKTWEQALTDLRADDWKIQFGSWGAAEIGGTTLEEINEDDWLVRRYEQRQDGTTPGEIISQSPEPGETLSQGQPLVVYVSLGEELITLPKELIGLSQDVAVGRLSEMNLRLGEVTEVSSNDVPSGTVLGIDERVLDVPAGSEVDLIVSLGPQILTVPQGLIGSDSTVVIENLRAAGFLVVEERVYDNAIDADTVLNVTPESGEVISATDELRIVVSGGPVPVPDLEGMRLADATLILETEGFCIAERTVEGDLVSETSDDDIVQNSVPPAGGTFPDLEPDEEGNLPTQCVQLIMR